MAWVKEAQGKVVKVISYLLPHLPGGYAYRVVFMRRAMDEILASQKQMLINRGEPTDKVSDVELALLYAKHLRNTFAWLEQQSHFKVLQVDYNQMLRNPAPFLPEINAFLGHRLDERKMGEVVDPNLYRQRKKGEAEL